MVWQDNELPGIRREDRDRIRTCAAAAIKKESMVKDYADACEYFFLFRKLHGQTEKYPEQAVLMGDYYFSRFSHALIPIDNMALIDRFSDYLKTDAVRNEEDFDLEEYLIFISQTPLEIGL